jgi:thiamine biosynthesis lipoprotein
MGTNFRIVLYAQDTVQAARAAAAAFQRVDALDDILSDYDPSSELSRLSNTAGTEEWVSVGDDLWSVLLRSAHLAALTGGAFDITVGPLTRLWRWANRRGVLPDEERIAHARAAVGHWLIQFDRSSQRVRLEVPGMRLDLGAIGKGFAADEVLAVLTRSGISRALIDAGGDIVASDSPPGTPGWRVEIPKVDDGTVGSETVWLSDGAVATSGDTYRYVEVDGVRYSHIIDPATGLGLTDRRVATVFAPTAAVADAFASAVNVLGPIKGIELVASQTQVSARVFQADGPLWRQWQSSGNHRN